jgi:sarcosine/dimethylglycine N-methyltransferase
MTHTTDESLLDYKPQDYGNDPTAIRETDTYTDEYVRGFVEKWDQLIDWDQRAESEGDFFIELLRKRGVKRVLDVATGTGFHSIRLIEAGFEVVSVDGSPYMLAKAFENGRRRGHVLRTRHADWRWLNRDVLGRFDAVICLGNSLTHLFSERDRRKALAEFYAALVHDGVLILDQRNYDAILDQGFSTKHKFYYCGDQVSAEPEHIDEGLTRFRYSFPDGSKYHLNMFPLRKDYTRKLMEDVGFQRIDTYGDFQETYRDHEPDFFVHVSQKSYDSLAGDELLESTGQLTTSTVADQASATARAYYNSSDADTFYAEVWGGEDIHVGLYSSPDEPIREASRRTVDHLADRLGTLDQSNTLLDIGAGYGGGARRLVERFGCRVICLNLSEAENARNREFNQEAGLDDRIEVIDGRFEDIPLSDATVDTVWSQDAILHSGDRERVLDEVNRVLKPGGRFVFTDPMRSDACPEGVLQPILERIHLSDLGSPGYYLEQADRLGWVNLGYEDHADQLTNHYTRVLETTRSEQDRLSGKISSQYIAKMKAGLQHWIDGGKAGHLAWGVFLFQKP